MLRGSDYGGLHCSLDRCDARDKKIHIRRGREVEWDIQYKEKICCEKYPFWFVYPREVECDLKLRIFFKIPKIIFWTDKYTWDAQLCYILSGFHSSLCHTVKDSTWVEHSEERAKAITVLQCTLCLNILIWILNVALKFRLIDSYTVASKASVSILSLIHIYFCTAANKWINNNKIN